MPGIVKLESDLHKIIFAARHVASVTVKKDSPKQVEVLWSSGKSERFNYLEDAQATELLEALHKAMEMTD